MNTTLHPLTTWWLLGGRRHAGVAAAASVVPDLPYLVALAIGLRAHGLGEAGILSAWSDPVANFVAQKVLHNLLLATLAGLAAILLRRPLITAVVVGWSLHVWTDLAMHARDAYSVLWPLTDRVFPAPVSYWDPDFGGRWVGGVLAALAAALWGLTTRRLWGGSAAGSTDGGRGRFGRRRWLAAGSGLLAIASAVGLCAMFLSPAPGARAESWIDDGVRWPPPLVGAAERARAGEVGAALRELEAAAAVPPSDRALAARAALLRGYALDLAGRRAEAIDAYRIAERVEPVGNVGDKARRYRGEPFRNVVDPTVSWAWTGLFVWGLLLCVVAARSMPAAGVLAD